MAATFIQIAEQSGSNSPDGGSGVLIIVISIVVAVLVVGGILTLVARKTRG
ncbi:MAG: hypothetical protein WKF29_10360 [Thermoleophilaceae bacterium]